MILYIGSEAHGATGIKYISLVDTVDIILFVQIKTLSDCTFFNLL